MFFLLTLLLIISSICLGVLYYNPQGKIIKKQEIRTTTLWGLWGVILICTMFICSNRAILGLVFNVHAPDVDFMQTINPTYMSLLITNFVYILIIVGIYYFLRKKVRIIQPIFLVLLLIATIAIYYPGIPSADGNGSYAQFQSHLYTDWQPPLFTIWWNIFRIQSATFLVNVISYYAGLIAISFFLLRKGKNWQNDLLVLFSLNPLLFTQLAIIWKDIGYTAFMVDCIAIYLFIPLVQSHKTRIALWGIYFLCLFLAIGFRINGIFAALPLMVAALYKILPKQAAITRLSRFKHGVMTLGMSLLVMVVFLFLNNFITYKLFAAKKLYAPEFVIVSDMAYIECGTDHAFTLDSRHFTSLDPELHNVLCDQSANEYNFDSFYNNWNGVAPVLRLIGDEDGYQFAKKEWLHAITEYPGTYLLYRARFFTNVIFFSYWYPTNTGEVVADKLAAVAQYQHYDMKFILGLFMLSATLTMFVLCLGFANYGIAFILICSCIAQLLGWYFLIPAHAARYFLWNYIGALLSIALISNDKSMKGTTEDATKVKNKTSVER